MKKVFGIRENGEYRDRKGAYLIPIRGNEIGVVETPKGFFLLGGGMEDSETEEQRVLRFPSIKNKKCRREIFSGIFYDG